MKDSQLTLKGIAGEFKYIKVNNERFSTHRALYHGGY